jgi:hypothetical protein
LLAISPLSRSDPKADESTATIAGLLGISLAGADLPIVSTGDVNGG